jgi:hypothetical protein
MAVKKTVEIDIKSNSKKADKDLKEIKKDIDAIGQSAKKNLSGENAKKLNKELDKTAQAAKNTKTRLRELEDELADIGDVNSPQFQKLAKEAGVLRDQMNNAKAAVRSMSEDFPRLQLGKQAFQAIGGAAQGAMGAAALFGSENEEVTKSIQKLVAVQSILNSVDAVAKSLGDETALGLKVRTVLTNLQAKGDKKLTLATIRQTVAQTAANAATKAGTVGMKIFNAAVKGSPIFWLVTVITSVVGAFAYFFSSTEDLTTSTENLNAAYEQLTASMDRVNDRRKALADTQMRILKATGASEEELRATRLKNLKDDEKARLEDLALQKAVLEEGKKLYKEAKEAEDDEAARAAKETIQKARDKYHTLKNMEGQYNASVLEELKSTNEKIKAQAEKIVKEEEQRQAQRQAKYKAFLQDKEAARKQIEDLTNQAIQDETARAEAVALTKRDRELAAVKGTEEQKAKLRELIEQDYQNTLTKIAEKGIKERQKLEEDAAKVLAKAKEDFAMEEENLSEIIRQAGQTDRQNEIDALNDHYFNLIETAKQHNLDVTALEQEQADKLAAIDKKSADEKKANEKEVLDAKLSMASDTFGALGDLATAFAKDDEKSAERAFKINKAVGIAQAVISTAQGVINAYANPVDVASGVAFGKSAIIAATGAAQIATIAKSKFQGGGAAGSSPTAPSSTAPSAASQPASFNVVGNTGVNQLAETLGNQGQQPIQAFVVGSEVTTQQSLDRNKVETATL